MSLPCLACHGSEREKLLLLQADACGRRGKKELRLGPGLGVQRMARASPSSSASASLRERPWAKARRAPYMRHHPSVHRLKLFPRLFPSLIAALSISLQSLSTAPTSPPRLFSHHGGPLLVLAHYLLPQVCIVYFVCASSLLTSYVAESWYRLVCADSLLPTRFPLMPFQNMLSTPSTKVLPP